MKKSNKKILVIAGPTASGKSQIAIDLAKEILAKEGSAVIINADSMQVYKEIPILSAQPGEEEKTIMPHLLYGFISGREEFSSGRWLELAKAEINRAHAQGLRPIVVGGTGLYLKALMEGIAEIPDIEPQGRNKVRDIFAEVGKEKFHEYLKRLDFAAAEKIRPSDKQRMLRAAEVVLQTGKSILYWQQNTKPNYPKEWFEISLILPDRAELYRRCDARFISMMEKDALAEVKNLREMKLPENAMVMKALGVKELGAYLDGKMSLAEATRKAQQSTRNYAKRQYTWFRNQP